MKPKCVQNDLRGAPPSVWQPNPSTFSQPEFSVDGRPFKSPGRVPRPLYVSAPLAPHPLAAARRASTTTCRRTFSFACAAHAFSRSSRQQAVTIMLPQRPGNPRGYSIAPAIAGTRAGSNMKHRRDGICHAGVCACMQAWRRQCAVKFVSDSLQG